MNLTIDPSSAKPPSEQLREQVAEAAASGSLASGHRLPTVRALASELGLAANTVAKAYRVLQADGVIETRGRAGSFVASRCAADRETQEAARSYAGDARRRGLSLDEALRLVEQAWS